MTTVTAGRGSHSRVIGVEPLVDDGIERLEQVGLEPHEHGLALGVAEPDVELEDLRPLVGEHQAGVEDAPERPPGTLQGVDDGNEDLALDLLHQLGRDDRGGRVGAHAAGVRALVVVVGPLVVLARLERDDRPAVGQGEDARLLAVEPFLDDQAVAGLAVDPPDHDLVDGVERLAEVVADVDPLAGGQAVGLEDHAERAAEDIVAAPRRPCRRPGAGRAPRSRPGRPGPSCSRGSMIRSIASSVSAAVRQSRVCRSVERPFERTTSETSRDRT